MMHELAREMIRYFEKDTRRINHALKVFAFARTICGAEGISDKQSEIVEAAALLHDIGIKESERKYSSSAWNHQEAEGPPVARRMMEDHRFPAEITDRVCFIIGHHHSYTYIDGIDFRILVEADLIVNMGEQNPGYAALDELRTRYFTTDCGKEILRGMYEQRP
jgi:HD superfamily phosphodiesterase